MRDPRVSLAIAKDYAAAAADPRPVDRRPASTGRTTRARSIMSTRSCCKRYPEYKVMPRPDPAAVPLLRITPEVVSILDYSKGFGHSDLVNVTDRDLADFVEARRHHWASFHAA